MASAAAPSPPAAPPIPSATANNGASARRRSSLDARRRPGSLPPDRSTTRACGSWSTCPLFAVSGPESSARPSQRSDADVGPVDRSRHTPLWSPASRAGQHPQGEGRMHAAVRRYKVSDAEAFIGKIEEGFTDSLKEVDGFVGYYVIRGGDNDVATVTVGE